MNFKRKIKSMTQSSSNNQCRKAKAITTIRMTVRKREEKISEE